MSGDRERIRVYVLLAWHPDLGAAADPVGVLAVATLPRIGASPADTPSSSTVAWHVAWIPGAAGRDQLWRARLTVPPTADALTGWLGQDGATGIREIAFPAGPSDHLRLSDAPIDGLLQAATDVLVDLLLAEFGPDLPA